MAKGIFKHVSISSIATAVPIYERALDDEIELLENKKNIDKIKRITGLDKRRIADTKTTSIDLCCCAAKKIMGEMNIDKSKIDAIIFVTQTPDYRIPNCASIVHGKLGLSKECLCYDINHGCSGYIYGLLNAFSLVESGVCKKILLLVGDTLSKVINKKDKSLAIIHGDAGSATIIEYSDELIHSSFILKSQGDMSNSIIIKAGGFRNMSSKYTRIEKKDDEGNIRTDEQLYMNGLKVFNFALQNVPDLVNEVLEFSKLNIKDIDFFAFHQANGIINNGIISKLQIDQTKAPLEVVKQYGNSSCCSIPQVISKAFGGKILRDKRIVMTGFGVGLSLGTCITNFNNTTIFPIIEYDYK
ncbi:3-oxoacyl-ACP synthase III family protein [Clostridium felsineum]|uniref:3-oxoacyl-ACP synthase III family protein n=1 Tax=Clostridium felsineum TaxID=36839 RepID=UPI00098C38AA|nr:ketoacyl-ACP synthase III [Clostridium felsineum]URZ18153.1 3-oxoacyl-[acyl-carrier-protein] synthase 3 [Clostridium felsineum DSM 794]